MRRIVDVIIVISGVSGVIMRGGEEDICLCSPEKSQCSELRGNRGRSLQPAVLCILLVLLWSEAEVMERVKNRTSSKISVASSLRPSTTLSWQKVSWYASNGLRRLSG